MKTFNFTPSSRAKHKALHGFTLVESMVALSLVAIMAVATAPSLSGIFGSGNFNNALSQVGGTMETAQEYAIAHNTYTYVGFTNPNADGKIFMAVFGAQDGSTGGVADVSTATASISNTPPVSTSGSSALYMLSRITTLQGVTFQDSLPSGSAILANNSLASVSTAASLPTAAQFTYPTSLYSDGSGAGLITFKRVVQFTPEGEGRVGAYIPTAVQVILAPTAGHSTTPLSVAASVIQIAGMTGQVSTFRP